MQSNKLEEIFLGGIGVDLFFDFIQINLRKVQIEKQIQELPVERMICFELLHVLENTQVDSLKAENVLEVGLELLRNGSMIGWFDLSVNFQYQISCQLFELQEFQSAVEVEFSILESLDALSCQFLGVPKHKSVFKLSVKLLCTLEIERNDVG